jgi:hypothetical protein
MLSSPSGIMADEELGMAAKSYQKTGDQLKPPDLKPAPNQCSAAMGQLEIVLLHVFPFVPRISLRSYHQLSTLG